MTNFLRCYFPPELNVFLFLRVGFEGGTKAKISVGPGLEKRARLLCKRIFSPASDQHRFKDCSAALSSMWRVPGPPYAVCPCCRAVNPHCVFGEGSAGGFVARGPPGGSVAEGSPGGSVGGASRGSGGCLVRGFLGGAGRGTVRESAVRSVAGSMGGSGAGGSGKGSALATPVAKGRNCGGCGKSGTNPNHQPSNP